MVKREAVKSIEAQKLQMISALYGNSAFDESEEGIKARDDRIKGIEEHFNKAVEIVYDPSLHSKPEDIDWANPFWAAAKRAEEQRLAKFRGDDVGPDATVGDVTALEPVQPTADDERPQRSYDQL